MHKISHKAYCFKWEDRTFEGYRILHKNLQILKNSKFAGKLTSNLTFKSFKPLNLIVLYAHSILSANAYWLKSIGRWNWRTFPIPKDSAISIVIPSINRWVSFNLWQLATDNISFNHFRRTVRVHLHMSGHHCHVRKPCLSYKSMNKRDICSWYSSNLTFSELQHFYYQIQISFPFALGSFSTLIDQFLTLSSHRKCGGKTFSLIRLAVSCFKSLHIKIDYFQGDLNSLQRATRSFDFRKDIIFGTRHQNEMRVILMVSRRLFKSQ